MKSFDLKKDNYKNIFIPEGIDYVNWGDSVQIGKYDVLKHPNHYFSPEYPTWDERGMKMEAVYEPKFFWLKKDGKLVLRNLVTKELFVSETEPKGAYERVKISIPYKCHRLITPMNYGLGTYRIVISDLSPTLGIFDCPMWLFSHKTNEDKMEYDMPEMICEYYKLFGLIPLWKKHFLHFAIHQYQGINQIANDYELSWLNENDTFEIINCIHDNGVLSIVYHNQYNKIGTLMNKKLVFVNSIHENKLKKNFGDYQYAIITNAATLNRYKKRDLSHSFYIRKMQYEPI